MSVVAVRIKPNRIEMSADSIIVSGTDKTPVGRGKIFKVNNMLIGSSGLASEGIMWSLFCENHRPLSATERGVMSFVAEFGKWKDEQNGSGRRVQNSTLLAFDGKVFLIEGDYIGEVKDYYAIGAGEYYAKAALYLGHSTQESVKVACELCCFVSEPIVTKTLDK